MPDDLKRSAEHNLQQLTLLRAISAELTKLVIDGSVGLHDPIVLTFHELFECELDRNTYLLSVFERLLSGRNDHRPA